MNSASTGVEGFTARPGCTFVGESRAINEVRQLVACVAGSDMNILICGETGTGKDLVARLIHEWSGRGKRGPFVKVNCPAIPEPLLESEMFGHEKGAFTGAVSRKLGRFEQANRGTIFLDEVGHVSPAIQAKLLDTVESGEFVRIGGLERHASDARVVAATNASLERLVDEGAFREDLYYRLCQFTIFIPPLRERPEDIPVLATYLLKRHCDKLALRMPSLGNGHIPTLMAYHWPGNVRELDSLMGRYALRGDPEVLKEGVHSNRRSVPRVEHDSLLPLRESEIRLLKRALVQTGYNQRKAAQLLGLSYSAFRRRMAKFGLREFLQGDTAI